MLIKIINHVNQRRALNRWLKAKRANQLQADELSPHIQKDIGLLNQGVEAPLTWQAPEEEVREEARHGKERAGPRSA